jgi:hypothetical protein|nr:MAG TPA_asm: hypothetical protein [Caudoviricetes sp.]
MKNIFINLFQANLEFQGHQVGGVVIRVPNDWEEMTQEEKTGWLHMKGITQHKYEN